MKPIPITPNFAQSAKKLQETCHAIAKNSGWWTDLATGNDLTGNYPKDVKINIAEKLCLIHSEISEAMEGMRKNLKDDHLPDRWMLEVELADAVIRIFDLAGGLNLDVWQAVGEKLYYNQHRDDHKPENRLKKGGKAF